MIRILISLLLITLLLLSCDNLIEIDDSIEIEQAAPNPAEVGDTLNILVKNINILLRIENIDQVKVLLEENNNTYSYQATGYYDYPEGLEFGEFHHSGFTDSLTYVYQPIIQCLIDSTYPSGSKLGLQLNDKTLKSNIYLNIND